MTTLFPALIETFKQRFPFVQTDEPMSKHTSFRIGGLARLYAAAASSDQLIKLVEAARACSMPWCVFGGGSNLLVADEGFEGLIIQAAQRNFSITGTTLRAESGLVTAFAARQSVQAGLAGFEWAAGIPGTLGGAIYGNAGCFGGEMQDVVARVDAYRVSDGQRLWIAADACRFAYRDSLFKHEKHVVLGCELELQPQADSDHGGLERLEAGLRQRKEKQPLEQASAGCAFKNFEFENASALDILRRQVDEVPAAMLAAKKISAGWLIDQAGLTGRRIGGIEVSRKHGNFLLNTGLARAQDVLAMISVIKMKVRDEFGIELEEEVQLVGF